MCSTRILSSTVLLSLTLFLCSTTFAQDSSGVSCLSRVNPWGISYCQYATVNYVYVGYTNGTFQVVNIQNQAGVFETGICMLPDMAREIVVNGRYAYVACGNSGLQIVDVAESQNPVVIGSCDTPGNAVSAAIQGNYVFVTDSLFGLWIVDVSSPANAQIVSGLQTNAAANDIAVNGQYVYLAEGLFGLHIVDISNIQQPVLVNTFNPGRIDNICLSGHFLYATGSIYLRVISIASPTVLTQTGRFVNTGEFITPLDIKSVSVVNNVAIVSSRTLFVYRNPYEYLSICAINISDSSNPVMIVGSRINTLASCISSNGNRVFLSMNRGGFCELVHNTNFSTLSLRDYGVLYPTGYFCDVVDDQIYLDNGAGSIRVINTSSAPQMLLAGSVAVNGYCIKSENGYMFCVRELRSTNPPFTSRYFFDIYQMNTPFSWTQLSSLEVSGYFYDVSISGNYAYIPCDTAFVVVRTNPPSQTQVVGRYNYPLGGYSNISIEGNRAYVFSRDSLIIFDITLPTSPQLLNSYFIPDAAYDLAVKDSIAYIANESLGLRILNVADPDSIFEICLFDTPGLAREIVLDGQYAYVADVTGGIRVVDVSNVSHPQEVGFYDTPGSSVKIEATWNRIYVSDWTNFAVYDQTGCVKVIDNFDNLHPQSFILNPNYPNPFNATTTIVYTIPKTGKVDLKVFDITGREVATLVNFHQNPGSYQVKFDGTTLATGTYFLRLQSGEFSQNRKMVLLK